MKFEMKKRILALALAGTTAFSVFGAAVSANAAYSTHVVFGNDSYTSYVPGSISATKTVTAAGVDTYKAVATNNYSKAHPALVTRPTDDKNTVLGTPATRTAAATTGVDSKLYDQGKGLGYAEITSIYIGTDGVVNGANAATSDPYKVTVNAYVKANSTSAVAYYDNANVVSATATVKSNLETAINTANGTIYNPTSTAEAVAAAQKSLADATARLNALNSFVSNNSIKSAVDEYINMNGIYKELYAETATPSPVADTYTSSATGAVVASSLSRKGAAVSSGNIYAYDYASLSVSPAEFAGAPANSKALYDAVYTLSGTSAVETSNGTYTHTLKANVTTDPYVKGYTGGYYNNRTDVIGEYENFLVEIGVADFALNGDLVSSGVSEAEFLSMYSYKYNGKDEYNFAGLVSDLYDTFYKTNVYGSTVTAAQEDVYATLPSSELVYLMQQYDKYVDGSYVNGDEMGEDKWAELLISALDAVDENDFAAAAQYTVFKNRADSYVNTYRTATSTAKRTAAVKNLYELVTGTYGRSAGTDKAELTSALTSLYFNIKNVPTTYQTVVKYNDTNAANVLYAYQGYDLSLNGTYYNNKYAVKATYPVYPVADYAVKGSTYGAEYTGNNGAVPDGVTSEYEWFANVYQLATAVAQKGNYQGIVDTVAKAMNDAADALSPAKTASKSASLALEEAVEKYDGKVEGDYYAAPYAAYTQSHNIADKATGKTQTAYAIEIATIAGNNLTYQQNQVTVTKGMIANLNTAIKNGEAALKALKNDETKYNAAQVNALNKAIADAKSIVTDYNGTNKTEVNHIGSNGMGDKDNFVVSDVNAAIKAIDEAVNYKNVLQGWSKNDAGKWQYGTENGYLSNGWNKVGKTWFYFNADGTAKQSEWLQENGKWYYFNSNCGALCGWGKVDGNWYYFKGDNHMKTGWEKVDGNWYYLASSGKMVTGWTQIDGKWYYFSKESNSLGQMLANTTVDGYKLDANGVWNK